MTPLLVVVVVPREPRPLSSAMTSCLRALSVGDGGGEVARRDVADDGVRVATLEVYDGDGVCLTERDVGCAALCNVDSIGSGAEGATRDGDAEIDGPGDLVGVEIDDRELSL